VPIHLRQRRAIDAGERGIRAPLDVHHARHLQAGRIDAIDAARGQQVALLHVGVARHEAQLHSAVVARQRIAIGNAARASAGIEHGNGLVAIDEQRHFAEGGEYRGHLAQHAVRAHHRRAGLNAGQLPLVDRNLA